MRKPSPKVARIPVVNPSELGDSTPEAEPELAPVASTKMTIDIAVRNLANVAAAVQGTKQTHALLDESIRVVCKHCKIPVP